MSTWQARRYYSSDEQSQIISKLIQKDILAKAETRKIQDDLIQLGDLSDSQLNITETLYAKLASKFTVWKLPLEPDNNRNRLWLHATNSVQLTDLSDFGAIAKFYGNFPRMLLGYDDGVVGNVLNPFLDGKTNYLRVTDNPNIRLNNIVGTQPGISFVVRAFTTDMSLLPDGSKRFFFSKIDDDLVTYAYQAFFDNAGVIYFIVRKNGVDYTQKTIPVITPQRDYSDFNPDDFNTIDFYTRDLPVYTSDDLVDEYVFTFKFSDNSMQIYKNGESLTLLSSTEPAVFPAAISNPPPLNNANLLTVTMTGGGTNVAFSNDANLTTRWEQTSLPASLVADLGQIKTIGYVQIAWYRASLGRIQTFQILVSDDNTTYVQIYSGQGLGTDALQRYNFPDVTGRYIKLNITANSEGASASVYEFQVWGFDPISVVYPIDTLYNVPTTGGDYFDLYSTGQSTSIDPVFGVNGTNSTDVQLKGDSGKTTIYNASGSGSGIAIHAAGTLVTVFSVSGSAPVAKSMGTASNNISICIEYLASSSVLVGTTPTKIDVKLNRHGNPSGSVVAGIWDISAGSQVYASPTAVIASSLSVDTSGYATYSFDFSTNNHVMAFDDGIGVAFVGSSDTNFVNVGTILTPTGGDGDLTYAVVDLNNVWSAVTSGGGTSMNSIFNESYSDNPTPLWSGGHSFIGELINSSSSVLIGKKIVQVSAYLYAFRNPNTPTGPVTCEIQNSSGATMATINSVDASTISTTNGSKTTFTNSSNTYVTQLGDRIIVKFLGGSFLAQIYIDSKSSGSQDSTKSCLIKDTGTDTSADACFQIWEGTTTATSYADFAMTVYTGSTVSTHIVAEYINSTSSVFYNQLITQVTVKMSATGAPSGSIYCRIRKASGATIAADLTIAASSLTTSFVAYTFNFASNTYVTVLNDQIEVQFDGVAGANWVNVQYDTSGFDTTNSVLRTQDTSNAWALDTAKDLAGTMLINNAPPIISAGEYIDDNLSVLYNKTIVKVTFKLAKVGLPTGNVNAYILLSGGTLITSTTTVSAASLPVSTGSNYAPYDFSFSTNAHVSAVGDSIYVHFGGGDPSNYVLVQREVGSSSGDTVHTTMRTQVLSGAWTNTTTDDTACTFYVSNIIASTAETRVAMNCAGDFGTFVNHVLNDFTFYLKKLGGPTGTIYFRIRDPQDNIAQDLGNYSAASLTTSNTAINFVNIPSFTHRFAKGDKITVEFYGTSSATDRVQIQQNDRTWFADPDTNEQGYNNISYSTVSNRVFAGIYKEGGQTVIFQEIDLAQEDVVTQPGYSHDLFLFACAEFEQQSQTWTLKQGFWKGIASQFRVYYDLLTLSQIQNLYANKISISPINYGEVLTGGNIMNLQP